MKKALVLIVLLLFPFVVKGEAISLYDVLKNEAESNGYAREYTGEHKDSFTVQGNDKIYHWYANDYLSSVEDVLEKNNVIFAGFCWKIVRTTDIGGVKLIYSGIPTDGRCVSTGANQQIGAVNFNDDNN